MPSNSDFKLEIMIADTPVPEYSKNGEHFVECNLSTPVSYMHQQSDVINGEIEVQVTKLWFLLCNLKLFLYSMMRQTTRFHIAPLNQKVNKNHYMVWYTSIESSFSVMASHSLPDKDQGVTDDRHRVSQVLQSACWWSKGEGHLTRSRGIEVSYLKSQIALRLGPTERLQNRWNSGLFRDSDLHFAMAMFYVSCILCRMWF